MKCAAAKLRGQHSQRDPVLNVLLNVAADLAHQRGLRISIHRFRPTAQASAVSRLFSRSRMLEELHVLPPRPPRWTRWPAKNARSRNAEHEHAIERAVALQHALPAPGFAQLCAVELLRGELCG